MCAGVIQTSGTRGLAFHSNLYSVRTHMHVEVGREMHELQARTLVDFRVIPPVANGCTHTVKRHQNKAVIKVMRQRASLRGIQTRT